MPLQQLVEYFNDRYEFEHNAKIRPFVLENGSVFGQYGYARVGSVLSSIHSLSDAGQIVGQVAKISLASNREDIAKDNDLESLLANLPEKSACEASIVDFDRLARTLHMLNFLPQSHLKQQLFLDVDPRHILGIKQDHGAYFEEVIVKCGLQTKNVTIALTVKSQLTDFIPSLLKGLQNYRLRGYQLALNFDFSSLDKLAHQLVRRSSPDFVGLSVAEAAKLNDKTILEKLQSLNRLTNLIDTRSIIYAIDHQHIASLASWMGFDWVHGDYFEQPFVKNTFYRPVQNASAVGSNSKIRR